MHDGFCCCWSGFYWIIEIIRLSDATITVAYFCRAKWADIIRLWLLFLWAVKENLTINSKWTHAHRNRSGEMHLDKFVFGRITIAMHWHRVITSYIWHMQNTWLSKYKTATRKACNYLNWSELLNVLCEMCMIVCEAFEVWTCDNPLNGMKQSDKHRPKNNLKTSMQFSVILLRPNDNWQKEKSC